MSRRIWKGVRRIFGAVPGSKSMDDRGRDHGEAGTAPEGVAPEKDPFAYSVEGDGTHRTIVVNRSEMHLLPCPELALFDAPFDHKVAAAVALALQECGYDLTTLDIGGSDHEMAGGGDVAYEGHYASLKSYLDTAPYNYLKAEKDAASTYGNWYTGLSWHYIRFVCAREGSTVRGNVDDAHILTLTWEAAGWDTFDDELATVRRYLCAGDAS